MILDRGYLDHWKTNTLRQLTGLANAAELPIRLWEYCEARRDDFIEDKDGYVIAGICRAPMEPKALVEALVRCRFLVKSAKGFTVHGWRERNHAWLAKIQGGKDRAKNAKRGADGKLASTSEQSSTQLAGRSDQATNEQAQLPTQLAGGSAGAVEWSGVEKSREPAIPPTTRDARDGERGGSVSILDQTASRLLTIFGSAKKRRLGREAEGELARNEEALPLVEEEWRLLAWWLALPADESDPFLREGSRPRDADKLAIRLFPELERAKAHAKKIGPAAQKKETGPAWPEGAQDWMANRFPGTELPPRFDELPRDVRDLWLNREAA